MPKLTMPKWWLIAAAGGAMLMVLIVAGPLWMLGTVGAGVVGGAAHARGIDSSDLRLWGSRLRRMDRDGEPVIEPGALIEFDIPGEVSVRLLAGVEVDGVTPLIVDPEDEA